MNTAQFIGSLLAGGDLSLQVGKMKTGASSLTLKAILFILYDSDFQKGFAPSLILRYADSLRIISF